MLSVVSTDTEGDTGITQGEFMDAAWTLYPRKVARKAAMIALAKVPQDQWIPFLAALAQWRRVWLKREELEYVPHMATWCNGERWHDELPADVVRSHAHASHVPFVAKDLPQRGEIPRSVRELIAKLKGGAR